MKRTLFVLVLIVFAATASFAQGVSATTIYFPHIVNGVIGSGYYRTTIFLTNPAASGTLDATITFTGEVKPLENSAGALSLSFTDQGGTPYTGTAITVTGLGPGQSVKLASSGTGTFSAGSAKVVATAPVSGNLTFANIDTGTGRLIGEGSVSASLPVEKQTIFVDTVGGYNVGVAYINPGSGGSANVQLRLMNAAGVQVATTTHELGSGNHRAAFPNEMFSAVPPAQFTNFTGTMQVIGGSPLVALALRYDPTFTIFTSTAPIQIASLIDAPFKWLAERPWGQFTPIAKMLASLVMGRSA